MKNADFVKNLFSTEPLYYKEGIPFFSDSDKYTKNYDDISGVHLESFDKTGVNPFMNEDHILQIEGDTIEMIRRYHDPRGVICDAGVGLGGILRKVESEVKIGLDISFEYLKRLAEDIYPIRTKLEHMPFKPESLDTLISTDVLEHVIDLHQTFLRCARSLKQGGHFIIRVPNEEELSVYLDYEEFDLVHVRNFSLSGLKVLLKKVYGFKYIDHRYSRKRYRGLDYICYETLISSPEVRELFEKCPECTEDFRFEDLILMEKIHRDNVFGGMWGSQNEHSVTFLEAISQPVEVTAVFQKVMDVQYE